LTGSTGFFGLLFSLFPEERAKGQSRLCGRKNNNLQGNSLPLTPLKRNKTFCLSSERQKDPVHPVNPVKWLCCLQVRVPDQGA